MNLASCLVLLLLLAAMGLALRAIRRRKASGCACGGNCHGCQSPCGKG